MPGIVIGLGIASLFFTAVGVAQQISAGKDASAAADEQKKIQSADRRLAELRSRKSKVEALRKGRIARATIINSAEQSGGAYSSGALGGASAVTAQTGANVGFLTATNETAKTIFKSNQNLTSLNSSINQKQAFASITGTLSQTFSPGIKPLIKSI